MPKIDKDPRRWLIAERDSAHEKRDLPVVAIGIADAGEGYQRLEWVAQQVAARCDRQLLNAVKLLFGWAEQCAVEPVGRREVRCG